MYEGMHSRHCGLFDWVARRQFGSWGGLTAFGFGLITFGLGFTVGVAG